jgi:hypothetical protein
MIIFYFFKYLLQTTHYLLKLTQFTHFLMLILLKIKKVYIDTMLKILFGSLYDKPLSKYSFFNIF